MAMPVTLIRAKFLALKPVMDERMTRLWAGAEAEAIGAGGITLVAAATGMSRTTIRAGRDELLVVAETGGSGALARRWKAELQRFADRAGLTIAVSYFPPATSKWTRVEHRVIHRVTESECGRPVIHRETAVQLIAGPRPAAGPGALPPLDARGLPAEWNYTLHPRRDRW
ncbi:MAG TPA: hypothetical protein VF516_06570 [Kofleriaceae bacterium]